MAEKPKVFKTEVVTCMHWEDFGSGARGQVDYKAVLIIFEDGTVIVCCANKGNCDPCQYER